MNRKYITEQPNRVKFTVTLDPMVLEMLKTLAVEDERSPSRELDYIIRRHWRQTDRTSME